MKPAISIIVPTYREAENLPELIEQLRPLQNDFTLELIIVDDNSADGTEERLADAEPWITLIVRHDKRGLSSAVIDGFVAAHNPILICMDADLSHPPSAIPQMVNTLLQNDEIDFVIGSRFVAGGNVDRRWSIWRWLNAAIAKTLARPFTNAKDPMSGFFCLRQSTFNAADNLNPIGYKIGLELIVKCHCKNIAEIPIHFRARQKGSSKLNFKEIMNYLRHIYRLVKYKLCAFLKN